MSNIIRDLRPGLYRALITQIGAFAPTVIELENGAGGTPTWSYLTGGTYRMFLDSAFINHKFFIDRFAGDIDSVSKRRFEFYRVSNSILELATYENDILTDSLLSDFALPTIYFYV